MIELPNGHRFEYCAASGALAYDGRGWPWEWPLRWLGLLDPSYFTVVTKSLTRQPRRGNLRWWRPWGCVRLLRGGTVNAVGLTNPGIEWWCRDVAPTIPQLPAKLIVSLFSTNADEFAEMARMLDALPIVGIELNCSCPNTPGERVAETQHVVDVVDAVRAVTRHPVLLKLSVTHDYCAIAKALQGKIHAIAINSVPWTIAFPDRHSPLAHFGNGGVSGQLAQVHTWQMLQELVDVTSTPIIGPSVWRYDDIARLRRLGAKAIGFGSIFLRAPWCPTCYVRREQRERSCAR